MSRPLRILFVTAEAAPFAKTGGLGDVCGSLPKALATLGHDVRIVMPAYASIEQARHEGRWALAAHDITLRVPVGGAFTQAGVFHARLPGAEVPVYFIAERHLFGRDQVYGYEDDPYRFAFFSRAALDLVVAALGWRPDVVHAHDWHAAPSIAWLGTSGEQDERYRGIATLFTIHNLVHQGRTSVNILPYLQMDGPSLREEGWQEVNLMARALYYATMINTVSPTYSREILTRDGGAGLDGLLRDRHFDVHGILNGLDCDVWDPRRDPHLARRFDVASIDARAQNKLALQQRLGLPVRPDVPLVAMVSRLDRQKGLDITGHPVHLLLNGHAGDAQFVVLGSGVGQYEDMFRHFEAYHRDKMRAVLNYDAGLAPLVYAGSDVFLMPSLFEPCGLGQLIAMRYGSVPVVRAVGGLVDTVRDGVTGFAFYDFTAGDCWEALRRALFIYKVDRESWRALQGQGMSADYSWASSARGYQQLYEWAIARKRGW